MFFLQLHLDARDGVQVKKPNKQPFLRAVQAILQLYYYGVPVENVRPSTYVCTAIMRCSVGCVAQRLHPFRSALCVLQHLRNIVRGSTVITTAVIAACQDRHVTVSRAGAASAKL